MKEITKMSRMVGFVEKLGRLIAEHISFVMGVAIKQMPIFTIVTDKPNVYGYATVREKWRIGENGCREIGISAQNMDDIFALVDTIAHEFVHVWQEENGIQGVSRGGYYHNKKFKEMAEKIGLKCVEYKGCGWNTINELNGRLLEIACEYEQELIMQVIGSSANEGVTSGNGSLVSISEDGQKKNSWRHVCPICGCKARTTKEIPLICGNCKVEMIIS